MKLTMMRCTSCYEEFFVSTKAVDRYTYLDCPFCKGESREA